MKTLREKANDTKRTLWVGAGRPINIQFGRGRVSAPPAKAYSGHGYPCLAYRPQPIYVASYSAVLRSRASVWNPNPCRKLSCNLPA